MVEKMRNLENEKKRDEKSGDPPMRMGLRAILVPGTWVTLVILLGQLVG